MEDFLGFLGLVDNQSDHRIVRRLSQDTSITLCKDNSTSASLPCPIQLFHIILGILNTDGQDVDVFAFQMITELQEFPRGVGKKHRDLVCLGHNGLLHTGARAVQPVVSFCEGFPSHDEKAKG